MVAKDGTVTVKLHPDAVERLRSCGRLGDTYSDIIMRLGVEGSCAPLTDDAEVKRLRAELKALKSSRGSVSSNGKVLESYVEDFERWVDSYVSSNSWSKPAMLKAVEKVREWLE
jgi:hypothetical protein